MKRHLATISTAFLFIFLLSSCQTTNSGLFNKTEVTGARILKYGIYTATTTKRVNAKNTVSGKRRILTDLEFTESTSEIPAIIGTRFGIRYIIEGKPEGRTIQLEIIHHHPPMAPPQNQAKTKSNYAKRMKIGGIAVNGFGFQHEWELVPGKHVLQIYYKSRLLVEKAFNVYAP